MYVEAIDPGAVSAAQSTAQPLLEDTAVTQAQLDFENALRSFDTANVLESDATFQDLMDAHLSEMNLEESSLDIAQLVDQLNASDIELSETARQALEDYINSFDDVAEMELSLHADQSYQSDITEDLANEQTTAMLQSQAANPNSAINYEALLAFITSQSLNTSEAESQQNFSYEPLSDVAETDDTMLNSSTNSDVNQGSDSEENQA